MILQPVAVGAWCSLCLVTAAAMLAMIPPALDEVVAMLQFMVQSRRQGRSLWRTFWLGGNSEGAIESAEATAADWSDPLGTLRRWVESVWHLLVAAALGVWMMFAPAVFQTQGAAADNAHVVGALIVTFAVMATAEVGRPLRFVNILLAGWLAAAPLLLAGSTAAAGWNSAIVGAVVFALSLPRGGVRGRYGSYDRYIR